MLSEPCVVKETDNLFGLKELVSNKYVLESKAKAIEELLALLATKSLNFEDEISLRGVECNIPHEKFSSVISTSYFILWNF